MDNRPRSPWYDKECKRCAHPQEIAQELDIDFAGSDFQFFDGQVLSRISAEHCCPPYLKGELDYDSGICLPNGFHVERKGKLHLWVHPDAAGNLPSDRRYAIGCDIAAGTGSSNSALSVGDCKTGEKVAELVTPRLRPDEFARYAVALARWFKGEDPQGAYLIWEAPGPGRSFGDVVIELGYRNIYYRTNEASVKKTQTSTPGWWPTKDEKRAIYSEYRRALTAGEFINRSQNAISECREIIFSANGWVTHSKSLNPVDPSGARENHGDRPTADALCWKGMTKRKAGEAVAEVEIPVGSMLWRREQYLDKKQKLQEW
tara:strand:- start:457 stop:1407 length:951 start_codon:yes stop_codon:yes gene_type:complete